MVQLIGILFACLVTALVFVGVVLVNLLAPSLGWAAAAGFAVLVFLALGGIAAWLAYRRFVHLQNWALERKDRAMQALHDARPLTKPLLIGSAGIVGLGLLRGLLRRR